jgi:N4-gp56 family major capsid protein
MAQLYNAPPGTPSTIGNQFNTHYWDRRSLIDAAWEMFFSPLADVRSMPANYGKELKVYYYVPLLDERNINDQGIDANGVAIYDADFMVTLKGSYSFAVEADATAFRNAVNAIQAGAASALSGSGPWVVAITDTTLAAGTAAEATAVENTVALATNTNGGPLVKIEQRSGNLYGSSKDIGTITSRMPELSETGGRVNRVGFTRIERSGTIAEYGFFTEFSEDSLTFDTDSDLYGHMSREMLTGANQITEDLLQIDLLSAAGTLVFTGTATSVATITGQGADPSVLTYADLKKLAITLDDNRTPKNTKVIKGSTMVDTKTINASRIMYIGSELQTTFENMTQTIGALTVAAFVPVRQYADATTIMNGEIGSVGDFRIVVVPNMMHWAGMGATATSANLGYSETGGRYDVFPALVVGSESFATVGLQSSGKAGGKQKFKIIVKKPGEEMATVQDPYGKIGFSSISFWYGFISLRPERIGLCYTVAPE